MYVALHEALLGCAGARRMRPALLRPLHDIVDEGALSVPAWGWDSGWLSCTEVR